MKHIIMLTGPSGTGKTTIIKLLLASLPNARFVTNTTTRNSRDTDLPGEYEYLDRTEFEKREAAGEFLWTIPPHSGNRYGAQRKTVFGILEKSEIAINHQNPEGASSFYMVIQVNPVWVQAFAPIYLLPPSNTFETIRRLQERGENDQTIQMRLAQEEDWERQARASAVPFQFIPGDYSIDDTYQLVREAIGIT